MTHGILLCDKPAGSSSHQVVSWVRRAFGTSKVGHAGTLDPMATGVLVVAVGEGLKILRYLTLDDKCYRATVRLGVETDTLDADGSEVARAPVPGELTRECVIAACAPFHGSIMQRPPAISAIKQAGVPLYKRARRGEAVTVPERAVTVQAIEVESVQRDEIELRVECGKGFYVRSFARDLAQALGTLGHLTQLRRLRSGSFDAAAGLVTADELRGAAADAAMRAELARRMVPVERALPCPRLTLDPEGVEHARHGRAMGLQHVASGCALDASASVEPLLLCAESGVVLALARCENETLTIVRGLHLGSPD